MNLKKEKGTSKEAPSHNYRNGTTPEVRSHAQILFDRIRVGRDHAVRRPGDPNIDRAFRQLIETANKSGDCIINLGEGYFRPGEEDEMDVRQYLTAELHRAKELYDKIDSMREAYYGRY